MVWSRPSSAGAPASQAPLSNAASSSLLVVSKALNVLALLVADYAPGMSINAIALQVCFLVLAHLFFDRFVETTLMEGVIVRAFLGAIEQNQVVVIFAVRLLFECVHEF